MIPLDVIEEITKKMWEVSESKRKETNDPILKAWGDGYITAINDLNRALYSFREQSNNPEGDIEIKIHWGQTYRDGEGER